MKEKELREHAVCSICTEKIGHTGLPIFWTVVIERHGVDLNAARRQDGLAMMIGEALASVMCHDEEMTQTLLGPINLTVCEECALENNIIIAAFDKTEQANEKS